MTFRQWFRKLAEEIAQHGLSIHDLPDADFQAWYEDGYDPAEAAWEMLAEEGFIVANDDPPSAEEARWAEIEAGGF